MVIDIAPRGKQAKADHERVLAKVKAIHRKLYGSEIAPGLERVFFDVIDLFAGKSPHYEGCDTRYHDLRHAMQVLVPAALIMEGWNRNGGEPPISGAYFELGIIGSLCHDSGYLKRRGDKEGTGAKYSFGHVERSLELAGAYLASLGYSRPTITAVQNIIRCTDLDLDLAQIEFGCQEEQTVGFSLGTADLLGQMSAPDYLDRLPSLYEELKEGYEYEGVDSLQERGVAIFGSAEELIAHLPAFYEGFVKKRLEKMGSLYRFLAPEVKSRLLSGAERNVERAKAMRPSLP